MKKNTDWIPVAAVVVGLAGIVWSFGLSPAVATAASLGILVFGATILLIRYLQSRRPEFTIIDLEKVLRLQDIEGHRATLVRTVMAASNIDGLREMWYRNVAADGPIENIKVDGQEPAPEDVVTQLHQKHIRKRFEPLRKGSQVEVSISYDLIDSFRKNSEALVHLVNYKTKKVRLSVEFPKGRPFQTATLTESYGGAKPNILKDFKGTDGGRLNAEIEIPKLGGSYELRWEW